MLIINRQYDLGLRCGILDDPVSRPGALHVLVLMDLRLTCIRRDFCRPAIHDNSLRLECH